MYKNTIYKNVIQCKNINTMYRNIIKLTKKSVINSSEHYAN